MTAATTEKPFEPFSSEEEFPDIPPAPVKKKRNRGPNRPKDPITKVKLVTPKDLQQEEFNHQKIRARAQEIAPNAMDTLRDILDKNSPLHKEATVAQLISAAGLVLDRAGDKPAQAPPDTSSKVVHYAVLDKAPMPTDDK